MRAPFATALLLLLAAPAVADEPVDSGEAPASPSPAPAWTVRAGTSQRWLTSESAVTLTESNLVGWQLAAERRLLTVVLPGPLPVLDVTTELGFARGSVDGTTFDQLDNHLSAWQLTAGARARLPVFSWLHVQARASVGGGKTYVRIADDTMPEIAIADDGKMAVASTGLGLAVLPRLSPRGSRGRLFMGVEAEVGYHTATAIGVHAYPEDRPSPELTIPAQYAHLGDLDLDGWTLNVAMTIGF